MFVLLIGISSMAGAQDSVRYIEQHGDQLILRIYSPTRSSQFGIARDNQEMIHEPNGQTNLGLGFNYKGFGLGVAFGIPVSEDRQRKFGMTSRFDVQGTMYNKQFGGDAFVQGYKGYYNTNPGDFTNWTSDVQPQLPEMHVFGLGINGFYIFNHNKFSYRAAYVRDEIQKRSAGSFTAGIFANYDAGENAGGFVPLELKDSVTAQFDLADFEALSLGITAGYFYTWVISDNFFLNAGAVPGFGYRMIRLRRLNDELLVQRSAAVQMLIRSSLGYEGRHFFLTINGSVNVRSFEYRGFEFSIGTQQVRFTLGRRFGR